MSRTADDTPVSVEIERLRHDVAKVLSETGPTETLEPGRWTGSDERERYEAMLDRRARWQALVLLGASALISLVFLYALWIGLQALL